MSKNQTILIVEDEQVLRSTLADTLRKNGFLTIEAKDGKEAISVALAKHPDLILLDLLMPIMDGIASLKTIRKDEWGKDVPVIILTNLSATDEQLIQDMVAEKPEYYLIKSTWTMQDIVKQIEKILGPRSKMK